MTLLGLSSLTEQPDPSSSSPLSSIRHEYDPSTDVDHESLDTGLVRVRASGSADG